MSLAKPQHCRREAYEYFAQQMPRLNHTEGLCRAAIALSMHELEDLHPQNVEQQLWTIAGRVADRVASDNPHALLAHLHAELFEHLQLRGDTHSYYTTENSYLSCVLDRGLGIPISLALVYKAVAERVGLRVSGINAPGHFLVAVHLPRGTQSASGPASSMLVDPFFHGRVLSRQEAAERIAHMAGASEVPDPTDVLPPATHPQWIARMLLNLEQLHEQASNTDALQAMRELRGVLESAHGSP